jgi:hypothetical protein
LYRFAKWSDALQIAPDEKTVAGLLRDYRAVLSDAGISGLPPDCQRALVAPIDIQAAAVTFLQCELALKGEQQTNDLLREIARTFAAASVRLTQLR